MNIKNFNNGDLIVRTEPGKYERGTENENLGITTMTTVYEDTSYIGEPVKFLDVCNGMIYVDRIGVNVCGDSSKRQLPLHVFKNGWDYFVLPEGYTMKDFEDKKYV